MVYTFFIRQRYGIPFYYMISDSFLSKLRDVEFIPIDKIGEGENSIVLSAKDAKGDKYALIIHKNPSCEEEYVKPVIFERIHKLRNTGLLNDEYIIKTYGSIVINEKLSDDFTYCSTILDYQTVIDVQELAEISLAEVIYKLRNVSIKEKMQFLVQLSKRLYEMFDYLNNFSLRYVDFAPVNLALIKEGDINTLVFIDIAGFHSEHLNEIDIERIINNFISWIIDYSSISQEKQTLIDANRWGSVTIPISTSSEESEILNNAIFMSIEMPDVNEYMHGYGLSDGMNIGGYTLQFSIQHHQVVRYNEYSYPAQVTATWNSNGHPTPEDANNVYYQVYNLLSRPRIIRTASNRPYYCDLREISGKYNPDFTQIIISFLGYGKRVSEAVAQSIH